MGWDIRNLEEVTNLITCGVAARPDYFDEGIPFLSAKNVKKGKLLFEDYRFISPEKHRELTKYNKPEKGDILYTRVGSYGEATIIDIDDPFSIFVSLTLIKPKREIIENKFLQYYLNSDTVKKRAKDSINGVGVGNLNVGTVRKFPVPIPKLVEQQAIVEKLDFAFDAIEKAKANIEKNIENAKELFQSKLNEIFSQKGEGWEKKKLKEMGKVQTGTTPKTAESDNYGDFIPFIKPADFNKDGSIVSKGSSLSEKGLKSGRLINENSALMVCIGATIGKTGYTLVPVSCNQQINAITPTKEFNYKFIYYGLISKDFNNKVLNEGKGAQATLPIINKSKWENLTMNVTLNLIEQKQIVSQLDLLSEQTNLLQEKYKHKLANLEELKKSILEKAFKGELV